MSILKNKIKIAQFSIILSFINFIFFHYHFFEFVFKNIDYKSFNGILMIVSLVILMIILNAFVFYLFLYISRILGKTLLVITFIISAVAVYFVNSYGVIIDESMIGNVFNTNYEESSSFFSFKLILYVLFLGILPSIYIIKAEIISVPVKKFLKNIAIVLGLTFVVVGFNAKNILWIDKNSNFLGGLSMPWSYTVNTALYHIHQLKKNEKEILLPNATIKDQQKTVVVLVIGESSRKQNYSLYGYQKDTNPLLSKTPNLYHYNAVSSATYTTAGVKSILEHQNTGDLYEILPNYLYRNKVDVVWRTNNSGEPPLHIKTYQKREDLLPKCKGEDCNYDGVLLSGLKEQILASKKNKILIVIHTSTSHGPTYSKKYPKRFEKFTPVCNSVELAKCSPKELVNAYDNTILYTDYLLHSVIENLQDLKGYKSAMIFVSDHGESLGENNLYMHGIPMSIAPKEQYEIPFIVWTSDRTTLKPIKELTQGYVFHSVLNFLNVSSPIYNEKLNIFKTK